jgi:hypothetical protein
MPIDRHSKEERGSGVFRFAMYLQKQSYVGSEDSEERKLINNVLFTPPGVEVESCGDGR